MSPREAMQGLPRRFARSQRALRIAEESEVLDAWAYVLWEGLQRCPRRFARSLRALRMLKSDVADA
jgi:hypothetical protein